MDIYSVTLMIADANILADISDSQLDYRCSNRNTTKTSDLHPVSEEESTRHSSYGMENKICL